MARNKGQATIWIILAVLLVGVVILFLSLEREPEKQDVSGGEVSFDVVSFLETKKETTSKLTSPPETSCFSGSLSRDKNNITTPTKSTASIIQIVACPLFLAILNLFQQFDSVFNYMRLVSESSRRN